MKKNIVLYALLSVLLMSCTVVPATPQYTGINPYYSGSGDGASFLEALNQAKVNTLQLAIIDLIGATEEMQSRGKLHPLFYAGSNPNTYLETDYMRILRRGETFRGYYCVKHSIYSVRIPQKAEIFYRVPRCRMQKQRAYCRGTMSNLSRSMLIVCCIWLYRTKRQKTERHFLNPLSIWQINTYSTMGIAQSIMPQ